MSDLLPLTQDKKLNVIFRVEPGCLGPEGADHIDSFCKHAQTVMEPIDSGFVHWEITPRNDKALPEMQYRITNKNMSHDQAEKYLALFDKSLDEFEGHLHDKLAMLIDEYLKR